MKKVLFLLIVSLLFGGTIHAQNHWTPDDDGSGGNILAFIAQVTIDEEVQTSSDIEIAMFVDGVCKSSVRIEEMIPGLFVANPRYNNNSANTLVTFKLYDHSNNLELDNCTYTLTTEGNEGTIGMPDPIVLPFTRETPIQTYEITLSANPEEGGTVSGGGTVNTGEEVSVVATANDGYQFVNWTENNVEVSSNATYEFTANGDRTLVANFEETSSEPDYPWEYVEDPAFNEPVTFIGCVQINGVTISDPENWDLGAFCGDEYRTTDPNYWFYDDEYQLFVMTIAGVNGDNISFKLYDKTENAYHGTCEYEFTFDLSVNYGIVGELDDPIILNFIAEHSYPLNIIPYDENENNRYYLIATPIYAEEGIDPSTVNNMLENEYDLYYFNQSAADGLEWINYKDATDGGFNLISGKGYLYANSGDGNTDVVTLTFTGTPYAGDGTVTLNKDDNAEFAGWNLVGNPFPTTAYITKPYYSMNSTGTNVISMDGNSILPMEGIFVIANEDGENMTFYTEEPQKNGQMVLEINENRGNTIDRVIVNFDANHTLPKFQITENCTKLFVPQNDDDYAVVYADENVEEMPLNFKAAENGTYTLSMSKDLVDMQYLRLVDQKTGTVVDLLANPVYTFDAASSDYANRFTLQFKANSNVNTNETYNPIQYFNNGQLSINGLEGDSELEIIDMLGRVISHTSFNGEYRQMLNTIPGVYMIRLTNSENTFTKKIVVK